MPAETVTEAVLNFLRCFVDPSRFDQGRDFAVREWARRAGGVRARIDLADGRRLAALRNMFARHGLGAEAAHPRPHPPFHAAWLLRA